MEREVNRITGEIVDASVKLHIQLGPGLFESVYEEILARDLERRGLTVSRQQVIGFDYDGMHFPEAFRIDLLVENAVVVELKSIEKIAPAHPKQLNTYLRLMNLEIGLLINFGVATLPHGIHRVVNNRYRVRYK